MDLVALRLLLEERLRSLRAPPAERMERIGVKQGMHIADLGAGKGYYSLAAASMVGPAGLVYAVEPDRARSSIIEGRAAREGLSNLKVVVAGAEKLAPVPDSMIDLAFSMNSMHHFSDRAAVFAELQRVLKRGGKFYVRDMIRTWYTWHGTPRAEVGEWPVSWFSSKEVSVGRSRLEATFTK